MVLRLEFVCEADKERTGNNTPAAWLRLLRYLLVLLRPVHIEHRRERQKVGRIVETMSGRVVAVFLCSFAYSIAGACVKVEGSRTKTGKK